MVVLQVVQLIPIQVEVQRRAGGLSFVAGPFSYRRELGTCQSNKPDGQNEKRGARQRTGLEARHKITAVN